MLVVLYEPFTDNAYSFLAMNLSLEYPDQNVHGTCIYFLAVHLYRKLSFYQLMSKI